MQTFSGNYGDFLELFLRADFQESFGELGYFFFGEDSGFVEIELKLGLGKVCVFVAVFEGFVLHGSEYSSGLANL